MDKRNALTLVAVTGLVACGQVASSPAVSSPSPKPYHTPSAWGLYVSEGESFLKPWHLIRVDAGTLQDLEIAGNGHGYAVGSADGSTLVEIDYQPDNAASISILDARSGALRTAFQSSIAVAPTLTPDGSRLLVNDNTGHSYRVFDTHTGQVTGRLEIADTPCCGVFSEFLDPTGTFLYGVLVPGSGYGAVGPVTPVLVRYDLRAGRESGRVVLTGVQAGVWQTDRTIGSEHVTSSLVPGIALSPDGSQLSILYDDGNRLMTIDTVAMKIASSRRVARPAPITGWFSLWPVDAEAKYDEGAHWTLAYSPDGRQLVASARQTAVDSAGNFSSHGLGIRLIDLDTASLIANVPKLDIGLLFFAPDGSALYATTVDTTASASGNQQHFVLLRIDPTTLAVAARRVFNGPRGVLVLAR